MKKLLLILLSAISVTLSAQDAVKKTVILYNVVPLDVDLAPDGTIISINGRADEYFTGYTLVKVNQYLDPMLANSSEFFTPPDDYQVTTKVYNVEFRNDLAILTRPSIVNIDDLVTQIAYNSGQKIMLTTYEVKNAEEKLLLENRLKTVLMYLEVKGVAKAQIAINEIPQTVRKSQIIATVIQ
ncbi:MAG: hypothetical protein IPL23_30090 [Saprospiraceae bacterium]|nr:hypothetical protein [Saprospiraceae bacterium]MBK8634637.1 hypothetical protein [Saprospiraceae bacterium]MBP7643140.1 hypothetical protein [Saprospiraceae bacterium]HMS67999.1 hypothetical protein [Saprospiraceae bacterium]